MSFAEMKVTIAAAYERNAQAAFMQQLIRDGHSEVGKQFDTDRHILVLSGPSGIGKTSCVKEFAAEREFQVVELDCSYMPAEMFAVHLYNAVKRINAGKIPGCVLMVDHFDDEDDGWRAIFDQYAAGYLDVSVNIADEAKPGKTRKFQQQLDEIPAELFIIGERRTG